MLHHDFLKRLLIRRFVEKQNHVKTVLPSVNIDFCDPLSIFTKNELSECVKNVKVVIAFGKVMSNCSLVGFGDKLSPLLVCAILTIASGNQPLF